MNIEIKNLHHSFSGPHEVINNLNLLIHPHSFHTIMGVSGVGKSVLLKLLAGIIERQKGEILNLPSQISFAFQGSPLFPWLNIYENLKICTPHHIDIKHALEQFNLSDYTHHYPHQLSGGMIQKVNIIRAFLNSPELILMDEPFSYLDSVQKNFLHDFTMDLWKKKCPTILFVTHDIHEALNLSEYISLFSKKEKRIVKTIKCDPGKQDQTVYEEIYSFLQKDFSL